MNVGILIYPDVEILDFCGPFEVFSVATRVARRDRHPAATPFTAFFVAETREPVRARYGFSVTPHHAFDERPPVDLLLVPGGVVDQPRASARTMAWIADAAAGASIVASVCTGAFLLAQAGLLDGLPATTHWEDIDALRAEFPAVDVVDRTWVDCGRIVTSAGVAAGIDMALHLVQRIEGAPLAQATARQMVYHPVCEPVPQLQRG